MYIWAKLLYMYVIMCMFVNHCFHNISSFLIYYIWHFYVYIYLARLDFLCSSLLHDYGSVWPIYTLNCLQMCLFTDIDIDSSVDSLWNLIPVSFHLRSSLVLLVLGLVSVMFVVTLFHTLYLLHWNCMINVYMYAILLAQVSVWYHSKIHSKKAHIYISLIFCGR